MGTWIDFKELRSKLRFVDVLAHYNVQLKVRGDRASALCPLPGHQSHGNGKRRSPSFSVNLTRGIFQCFSCGAKGNVLDFACLMEGFNPNVPTELREGAIRVQNTFGLTDGEAVALERRSAPAIVTRQEPAAGKEPEHSPANTVVNAPLDFELKNLDPSHPYLASRGFSPETIAHFGLGYCSKGLMAGRIAIPLHDAAGKLIGYAGRLVDDAAISDDEPKYLFPGTRERAGVIHEFRKGEFLYNYHQICRPSGALVVVEGFASVWWLFQHGHRNCVAVMGASCAAEQGKLIVDAVDPSGFVLIFTDGDDAGCRCAGSLFNQVGHARACRYIPLADGTQPTDCDANRLASLMQT